MKRVLLAFVAGVACVPPEEAAAPASVVVAPAPAAPPPAARRNLFSATTACDPGALCPVFPSFPVVTDLYFDTEGRPCVTGQDRHGCLAADGWHFAVGAGPKVTGGSRGRFDYAPEACRLAEAGWVVPLAGAGTSLFWRTTGERVLVTPTGCRTMAPVPLEPVRPNVPEEGIIANDPNDVWVWSARFIGHFDGRQWERVMLPPPCIRESLPSAVTAPDGTIWFARCEEQMRVLVRFDPRTNLATATTLAPMMGLALVGGKVTATDFDDEKKTFRRHVFEADGRDTATSDGDQVFLRAGFPDGTAFSAGFGLFSEIQRTGGDKIAQTIALPSPAEGFYAPTPREVWAGGQTLQRWRDGMMEKITYRPDAAQSVVTNIGGSGSNDIWVASRPARGGERTTHLSHWNGTTWQQADISSDERVIRGIAVASPSEAWITTETRLWRWNGANWSRAGEFPAGQGAAVVLGSDAVFVLGSSTIYRRSR